MLLRQRNLKDLWVRLCSDNYHLPLVFVLCAVGFAVRLIWLGTLPAGLNQDEAYAGYEAFSMLKYGTDSWGYPNPVYFISWGSGMNALNSYLIMPFIWIFGPTVLAIRLPQALLACASLPVFYKLMRELFNIRVALAGLLVLVVNPWHIMMSRWGLECNIAPAFLLFGFYFFIIGLRRNIYFVFSSLSYGLCLYAYATMWVFVPILLGGQILFALSYKRLQINRLTLTSLGILTALAVPLLLFLCVQYGKIPEVKTSLISIPKLINMRSSEFAFDNVAKPEQFTCLFNLLVSQHDGGWYNSLPGFGLYFLFGIPLAIAGIAVLIWQSIRQRKRNQLPTAILPLWFLAAALVFGLMITDINVNRINALHFAMLISCAAALGFCFLKARLRLIAWILTAAYLLSFGFFIDNYIKNCQPFDLSAGEAIQFACEITDGSIHMEADITHPVLLFYSEQPTDEYVETVEYTNYSVIWLPARSFGRFTLGEVDETDADTVYIIDDNRKELYRRAGFTIKSFEHYSVAYVK